MISVNADAWYTREEVCRILGWSRQKVGILTQEGKFPQPQCVKGYGKRHYWRGRDILGVLEAMSEQASAPDLIVDLGVGNEPFDGGEELDADGGLCTYRCCRKMPDRSGRWVHELGMCEVHAEQADRLLSRSRRGIRGREFNI